MNPSDPDLVLSAELNLCSEPDQLFLQQPWPKPFEFDEAVVRVFDDMVSRSVPLYREVLIAATQWTLAYAQPQTRIIDVGCSTGTFLEFLSRYLTQPATLVGIDNSAPMIAKAQEKLGQLPSIHTLELICGSAETCNFAGSSVVVMNYTLQFLSLSNRQRVLSQIFAGLLPGGLLFLSEKVMSAVPQIQETITQGYELFKARNGYASTEIERKKEALEQVLIPLTEAQQRQMLQDCGFETVDSLIKFHNFMTFVAFKPN
jgi:tRNA (cmo5U34)-methyltransferase